MGFEILTAPFAIAQLQLYLLLDQLGSRPDAAHRLAEERIGEAADYGVITFISNSSYLTGRSHPLMRRSLLSNFDAVWIDNLNGDKYRTGKIIPTGLPGAGTRDDSAFTTEMDPRGIQPGTAIVMWVKRTGARTKPADTAVLYPLLLGSGGPQATTVARQLADRIASQGVCGSCLRSSQAVPRK